MNEENKKETQVAARDEHAAERLMRGDTPAEMIRLAVSGGADLEKLEKLLELQHRWEANEAKKAYHEAMAAFKADPPKIVKDKSVSFGETSYKHVSLNKVCDEVNKSLSGHGLSASWKVSQNGSVSVTCKITHKLGHSEETTLSAPPDSSGKKNSIQAIGSTITYLERYTLLALVGLAAEDQDDDGCGAEPEAFIGEQELSVLRDHITDKEIDEKKFLAFLKIESLEKMPKSQYQNAINLILTRKKKQK